MRHENFNRCGELTTELCYVCRSPRVKSILDREGFEHLACSDCRLLQLHPSRFVSGNGFYIASYFNGQMFRETNGKYGYPECYADLSTTHRAAHYREYINEIIRLFGADQSRTLKILDFGCGYGFFLKTLLEKANGISSIEVCGIELNAEVCSTARTTLNGAPVYCVDLKTDDSTIPRSYFDMITMLDVLEHLDDPRIYLKRLAAYAKNNGYLLLSTPNVESFNARLYRDKWALHSPPYHPYYFGPRSIRILLEQTGWRIVSLHTERTIFHNERSGMETWRGKLARAMFQNRIWDLLSNRVLHIGSIMVVLAQRY